MSRPIVGWQALRLAVIPSYVAAGDPVLAAQLQYVVVNHVEPGTRSSYNTGARSFAEFCLLRGRAPFPVCGYFLCMWILDMATLISVRSLLGTYMAGVKDAHKTAGLTWTLHGDPYIYRTIRWIKKRYGLKSTLEKAPITLANLHTMARRLPGWPNAAKMSHNDRLWVAASGIGIMGFLRGGEFLASSERGARPLLLHERVGFFDTASTRCVTVSLDRPKATWWEPEVQVRCHRPGGGCPVDPVLWLSLYRHHSTVVLRNGQAAFKLEDGSPLTKVWMLEYTRFRMLDAGITYVDRRGLALPARASSWRCGGVASARLAKLSDITIKALGRWASDAWLTYAGSATQIDFLDAAQRMWIAAQASPQPQAEGGLTSVTVTEDVAATLPELHGDSIHQPRDPRIGDVIATKWGPATVVRLLSGGDVDCTWGKTNDCYRLKMAEGLTESADDVTEVELPD
jgi:hypothetical protein